MLKYPCLVLDHDDTVVQSEASVNYPFFCHILDQFRPGTKITLEEYMKGCFHPGFIEMCKQWYGFTEEEQKEEYVGWVDYVRTHIPAPYPGIDRIIYRQKEEGGMICVVSHSVSENIIRDYKTHFGVLPDAIYGWDMPAEKRKPNPYPLQKIMDTYGFAPEQLLVVDDLKPAWQMAKSVDVPIAFAAWSKTDVPEIIDEMSKLCDYTFRSPAELETFLF